MKLNKEERDSLAATFRYFRMIGIKLDAGDKESAKRFLGAGLDELQHFAARDPKFNDLDAKMKRA